MTATTSMYESVISSPRRSWRVATSSIVGPASNAAHEASHDGAHEAVVCGVPRRVVGLVRVRVAVVCARDDAGPADDAEGDVVRGEVHHVGPRAQRVVLEREDAPVVADRLRGEVELKDLLAVRVVDEDGSVYSNKFRGAA